MRFKKAQSEKEEPIQITRSSTLELGGGGGGVDELKCERCSLLDIFPTDTGHGVSSQKAQNE